MNDFEKYIKHQQRNFDLKQINPQIWQNIESSVGQKQAKVFFLRRRWYGVAVALLIGVCCFQWFGNQKNITFSEKFLESYRLEDSNIGELMDSKINTIKQASIPVAYKNDLEMLLSQVKYLDQHFTEKLSNLNIMESDVVLKKEILAYYKTKSEILDRVIGEIQKINSNEEQYNIQSEKTSIRL